MVLNNKILHNINKKLIIDRDILWILINKAWSVIKGILSVYFIIRYLSPEEQGLWYVFINLGALSIFAELGFTTIITQFVSHEYAHVVFEKGILTGKKDNLDRIISLIRFSVKFYTIVVPVAIIILSVVGFFYFDMQLGNNLLAWFVYSIVGGFTLLSSLLQAIYQGLDKVKHTQKNILIGAVIMPVMNWIMLYFNFGIWALVLGNLVGLTIMLYLLFKRAPGFWIQVVKYKLDVKLNWFNEIIKLQWKYAVSWISGYFIFHLLIPAVYKYETPIIAGQLGATMSIVAAIKGVAYAWVNSKIPKFNILASKKDRKGLLALFKKYSKVSLMIYILLVLLFILMIYIMNIYNIYNTRFIGMELLIPLIISQIPSIITGLLSFYLRSHKIEPYYVLSALSATIFIILTFIILPAFGLRWFYYALIIAQYIIVLPLSLYIYYNNRNKILPKTFYI